MPPKKPPEQVHTEKIEVRLTERERRMLSMLAATHANQEYSALIRDLIVIEFSRVFPQIDPNTPIAPAPRATCGATEPTGAIGDNGRKATCERLRHPPGTMHEGNGLDWYDERKGTQ